ncbi:MAG TPA: hotdog fold thioesterase [Trebonia sp.]|jgi:uncharacterized protein (TIGR00369 family)
MTTEDISTPDVRVTQDFQVTDFGPERTFRVGPVRAISPDGTALPPAGLIVAYPAATARDLERIPAVRAEMLTGPWLAGPGGIAPGGVLGVLADGLSAYSVLLGRPESAWSVSAEISLDLCAPVPADGTTLTGTSRIVATGAHGGLGSGSVTDASGRVIAQFRQHTRWVPGGPAAPEDAPEWTLVPAGDIPAPADLTGLLDAQVHAADGGAVVEIPVTRELTNPLGNMHGGVIFTAVDLAAQAALLSADAPVRTASVRVAYARPLTPGAPARFEARVLHRGRSFGVAEVRCVSEANKPCVIATVTTTRG